MLEGFLLLFLMTFDNRISSHENRVPQTRRKDSDERSSCFWNLQTLKGVSSGVHESGPASPDFVEKLLYH
jgi:hypothetical protein